MMEDENMCKRLKKDFVAQQKSQSKQYKKNIKKEREKIKQLFEIISDQRQEISELKTKSISPSLKSKKMKECSTERTKTKWDENLLTIAEDNTKAHNKTISEDVNTSDMEDLIKVLTRYKKQKEEKTNIYGTVQQKSKKCNNKTLTKLNDELGLLLYTIKGPKTPKPQNPKTPIFIS